VRVKIQDLIAVALIFVLLAPVFFSVLFGLIGLSIPASIFSYCVSILLSSLMLLYRNPILSFSNVRIEYIALLFFCLAVIFSHVYSISPKFKGQKLIWFIGMVFMPAVLVFAYSIFYRDEYDLIALKRYFVIASLISLLLYTAVLIFDPIKDDSGRVAVAGLENTIYFAQAYGLNVLIVLISGRLVLSKTCHLPVIVACSYFLFSIGSRGPILALLVTLTYLFLRFINLRSLLRLLLALLILVVFMFFVSDSYIFETNYYSIYHRVEIITQAINKISLSNLESLLFGVGIGGSGIYFLGEDVEFYPHNLILEIIIEYGVVGLVLFISAVMPSFLRRRDMFLSACFVYVLCLSMFSGDLVSNSLVFIFLSCLNLLPRSGFSRS